MKYFIIFLSLLSLTSQAGSIFTPSQQTKSFLNNSDERSDLYRKDDVVASNEKVVLQSGENAQTIENQNDKK